MKKYIFNFSSLLLLLGLTLGLTNCSKDFEEYNQDPFALTEEDLQADYRLVGEPFVNMIRNIYVHTPAWITQLQQNLIGDVYSGYMMPPTPFAGNSNNMNYDLVDGWNTWAWNPSYTEVLANIDFVKKIDNIEEEFPEFIAWSNIIKVAAMHRVTDMFGPIIYSKFGEIEDDGTILYDCQEDVYTAMFADLDSGIRALTEYSTNNPGAAPFAKFDEVYGKDNTENIDELDMEQWIQLANSLRLRLAIRVSKVNPSLAQTEAEAAVNQQFGVITENAGNFTVKSGLDHPMNTINNAWNDIRMGAPMESILVGYEDPRLPAYFQTSGIVPNEYKGIRQGIPIADKGDYVNFSPLKSLGDVQLMVASEVYFLRAEGAMRGWNMGGTAQEFYEEGIRKSFEQHGAGGAETYLADNTKTAIDYVDAFNSSNNATALSSVTIAWDDAAGMETKLERIITQKWIAMFPDGQEAWSEYRRTGYPALFPVVLNNSGGEIDTDEQIKRIKYVSGEYTQNPAGVASGVSCLGGPDTGGTPLWWDID